MTAFDDWKTTEPCPGCGSTGWCGCQEAADEEAEADPVHDVPRCTKCASDNDGFPLWCEMWCQMCWEAHCSERITFQTYTRSDDGKWWWGIVSIPAAKEYGPFPTEKLARADMDANPERWHDDIYIGGPYQWTHGDSR